MSIKIYEGSRGQDFKNKIVEILKKGKIRDKYINSIVDDDSLKLYNKVFTSKHANPIENYEQFEQMGDLSINKFIVWYCYNRFYKLNCTEGVKVVARVRIKYSSKKMFSNIAEKIGFWEFISAPEDSCMETNIYSRKRNKLDLLEDCFEAFIGCTEYILDQKYKIGVGWAIVFDILKNIFDKINISLNYNDLFDPKTRLKELFDFSDQLDSFYFVDNKKKNLNIENTTITTSDVYHITKGELPIRIKNGPHITELEVRPRSNWIKLGSGIGASKMEAQQKAAQNAIDYLRTQGIEKPVPTEYAKFL